MKTIFRKQETVQLIIILIKRQLIIKIIITIQIQTKNAKRFMTSKITRQKIQKSKMMMNKMTLC
jgi:hypothetical protein